MAVIGALSLDCWRGTVQSEQKPVDVVTRSGVAGTGLVVGAAQATAYTVETEYYGTYAQVTTWRDTALGYVGTSQSVTDAHGTAWADTAILGISFIIRRCKLPTGGSHTHLITATWQMLSEV
jgi:hypothetical protein